MQCNVVGVCLLGWGWLSAKSLLLPVLFAMNFVHLCQKKRKVEDQGPDLPTSKTINCTYFEIKTLGYRV